MLADTSFETGEDGEIIREEALAFYSRLSREYGIDIDLEAVIRESREVNLGPDL